MKALETMAKKACDCWECRGLYEGYNPSWNDECRKDIILTALQAAYDLGLDAAVGIVKRQPTHFSSVTGNILLDIEDHRSTDRGSQNG